VAEELVFGEISTGASDDLRRATSLARRMVVEFGMSPKLGPISFGSDGRGDAYLFGMQRPEMSEETARVIDAEVSRLVNEARDRAREILQRDRDLLVQLAKVLFEREVMEGEDLKRYLEGKEPIPTEAELEEEAKVKAASNGKPGERHASGPEIIPAGANESGIGMPIRPDV